MRIVMLSDNETKGGAAVAASRLAEALIRDGHEVTRIVGEPDGRAHHWRLRILTTPASPYWRGARFLLPEQWKRSLNHSHCRRALDNLLAELQPDVINVHNLHGAAWMGWQPDFLEVCLHHAPTVWTLHDMWSFTGRCACNYDCRKFVEGCDATCPTPREYPALAPNRIEEAWKRRQELFRKSPDLVGVAPSHWLAGEASAGFWANHRLDVIPNGLPMQVYQPVERKMAREALGIPLKNPVALIAAADLSASYKGGEILIEALRKWCGPPFTLVTLGAGEFSIQNEKIHHFPLGYVSHERTKVLAYSAASLLIHPAPLDNLPNVIMESLACGTPVVAFDTGGIPEMVRPAETGWIVSPVSSDTLTKAVQLSLSQLQTSDYRESCRAFAELEYSDQLQAQRYAKLFEELVKANSLKTSL